MKLPLKKSTILISLVLSSQAYGQDYYVDVNGSATGIGTVSEPFNSISAAITEANGIKAGSDTIYLRAGRYQVPVIMSDIGDATNPIIITPYSGEESDVIIDGSALVSELGGTTWEKLAPDSPIYKTTITEDIWQLWVNEKMAVVARWPNVTVGHPTDPIRLKADNFTPKDNTWWDLNGTWGHMDGGWVESTGDATMLNNSSYHKLADLGKSIAGGSVIINFHSETQFSRNISTHTAGTESFDYDRVKRPYDKGQGYFIIEHKNVLDMPGEWYYDKDTREVWLWPEVGQDLNNLDEQIRGKVSTYAFDLTNAQYLTFKGLTFFGTTISCKDCDSVTIEGNKFLYPSWHDRMLGNHRIYDDQNKKDKEGFNVTAHGPGLGDTIFWGKNYRVKDNTFAYSDAYITMNKGPNNKTPDNNQVENNLFHHFSFTGMAHSILAMNSNGGDSWQKNNTFHTQGSRAISKVAKVDVSMSRASHWGYLQQDGVAWQAAGGFGAGGGSDGVVRNHLWVHDAFKPAVRWDGFDGINGTDHHVVAVNIPALGMIKGDYHKVYNSVGVMPHDPNETMFKILNTNESWGGKALENRNENSLIKNNLSSSISGARTGYLALTATDENNWNGYLKTTSAAEQLRDPINFDFRPKLDEGSFASGIINQGQALVGYTDDVTDGSPDIGAYESGADTYWIPGYQYPSKATSPVPRLNTQTAKIDADLMWLKAKNVIAETLFFGTSIAGMAAKATFTDATNIYEPGALTPYQTYYWRVDTKTVESGSDFVEGDVWSFTVEKPLISTVQTVTVTEDTHVESGNPTNNFDGATQLKIHTSDVGVVDKVAFLKFTVPTVIDSELSKVTLRLHRDSGSATKGVQIYAMADTSWDATTLTWNNIPEPNNLGTLITTFDVSGNAWQEIDVTAHVNEGVVAFALGREPNTNNRTVDSAESAFAPELLVEHVEVDTNAPPEAPANLTSSNDLKDIALTWLSVTNAVGYNVYRRISPDDHFVTPLNLTPLTVLNFSDNGAVLNTTYQYVVKAIASNDKESFNSNVEITALVDNEFDGMADSWENYYGLNTALDDSASDLDSDGKTNLEEYIANTDPSGNAGTDTTAPVITLTGSVTVTLNIDENYVELGATAIDNVDGNTLTVLINSSAVNSLVPGTYVVTYNVTDNAGNESNEVVRTISVVDDSGTDGGTDSKADASSGGGMNYCMLFIMLLFIRLRNVKKA